MNQYDQAGLMIRISSDCWLKTSVEYEPHTPNMLGAVVTNNGYSDWSTQEFPDDQNELLLRIKRERQDYIVEFTLPNFEDKWSQIRMTHFQNKCLRQRL